MPSPNSRPVRFGSLEWGLGTDTFKSILNGSDVHSGLTITGLDVGMDKIKEGDANGMMGSF